MKISKIGLTLGVFSGILILCIFLFIFLMQKRQSSSKNLNRLTDLRSSDKKKVEKVNKLDVFLENLDAKLKKAEVKMTVNNFIFIIFLLSMATYIGGYMLTKTWLVPIALLSFPTFFFPTMWLESRERKIQDRFNTELVMVLRRMSAITKNDSILAALEDVKDYPSYSLKMRAILTEIYLHFTYGDPIEEAFMKVANKNPSGLLRLIAISIGVNKTLGSNLSANLHEISAQIQNNMLMQKEAKAIMMTTSMTAKMMCFIPYGILGFLFIYNDTYFNDFFMSIGNQIIFAAILFMMSVGVFVVSKMSQPPEI